MVRSLADSFGVVVYVGIGVLAMRGLGVGSGLDFVRGSLGMVYGLVEGRWSFCILSMSVEVGEDQLFFKRMSKSYLWVLAFALSILQHCRE